jgi:hypothetical protein
VSSQRAGKAQPAVGEWKHVISGRPKLTLYEVVGKQGTVVWAQWWDGTAGKKGAPRTKTTGMSIRFPPGHRREGEISPAREQEILQLASRWHADLVAGNPPGTTPLTAIGLNEDEATSLTVAEGFAKYLDLGSGAYPDPSDPARRDVMRAAEEAKRALGGDRAISSLVPMAAAQELWRHVQRRVAAGPDQTPAAEPRGRDRRNRHRKSYGPRKTDGATWAQRVVHHFFACMGWLRSRGHLPEGVCMRPSDWHKQFTNDWRKLTGRDLDNESEEDQPRFTPAEAGSLLDAVMSSPVDPRLRIAVCFGGDSLRAGQVVRVMRSDLDLSPCGEFGLGRLRVRGKGKKKGSVIDLDEFTRSQIDFELTKGYLRECEGALRSGDISDYALMPQGRFVRGATPVRKNRKYLKPISRRTLLDYFHSVEEAAGVEHVAERAWYGLRRLWADLGPEHVQTARAREILGGWARGSTVPQKVYKTKQDELAIREASRARSAIREELRTGRLAELTELRSAASAALSICTDPEALRHLLRVLRGAEEEPPEPVDEPSDT